jgi:hypothetical protein
MPGKRKTSPSSKNSVPSKESKKEITPTVSLALEFFKEPKTPPTSITLELALDLERKYSPLFKNPPTKEESGEIITSLLENGYLIVGNKKKK